jgi:two-component system, chemotaxis family, response regulator Rcp1
VQLDRPLRVLVVEDNPADVELLRMAMDHAGVAYEMTQISDGAEALLQVRQMAAGNSSLPDVIVMDLNLPKYDGLEVLEEVRSHVKLSDIPVTILTSSSSRRERLPVQMFRRVCYLTKPLDLDQYLNIGSRIRDFLAEPVHEAGGARQIETPAIEEPR